MRSYRKAFLSNDRRVVTHTVPFGKTPTNPGELATDDEHVAAIALFPPIRGQRPFEAFNALGFADNWVSFTGTPNIHWLGFDQDNNPVADLGTLGGIVTVYTGLQLIDTVFLYDYYSNHPLD